MNRIKSAILIIAMLVFSCALINAQEAPTRGTHVYGKVTATQMTPLGAVVLPVSNATLQVYLKALLPNGNDSWMDLGTVQTDSNGDYVRAINPELFPYSMYTEIKVVLLTTTPRENVMPYEMGFMEINFHYDNTGTIFKRP